ncbi:lipid catabolic process [Musa troglodytarum]|uniref:Lipid catabolic process n=1 Tax=Musa troglodytarum TaxID=320322 RepID=A0A9E7H0U6_9LILI|nr:lipid catabolic process [Musa troglodytarum]
MSHSHSLVERVGHISLSEHINYDGYIAADNGRDERWPNRVHAPHIFPAQATPSIDSSEMASFVSLCFFLHLLILPAARSSSYPAIFGFGNSLTDTGNLVFFSGGTVAASRLPYGETFFGHPSGRFSDGRLVIDYIAQALRLPLVPPYLAGNSSEDFKHGANFAVGGACALGNAFFEAEGLNVTWQDYSLSTQFKWFEQLLQRSAPSLHSSQDTISKSLFLMGEMGVNDYSHLLFDKKDKDRILSYVPTVVHAIGSTVNSLIQKGAETVIVAGVLPLGCSATYLTFFQTQSAEEYDPRTGCLRWANELSHYHNLRLHKELNRIRKLHPHSKIFYADYYTALMPVYQSPEQFGMKEPLAACCGGEGPYNVNFSVACGHPMSNLCSDPSTYVCWDGLHLTDAAHGIVARRILKELFGDSLADTGNAIRLGGLGGPTGSPPYGRTFFNRPTGRFSDGRLIVDFIAQGLGLPLLPPYLGGGSSEDFRQGVNFAVAGATALDLSFFREKGIQATWTDKSLHDVLNSSLILMGEIGGNDYNQPFFQGIKVDEIRPFVPSVISATSSGINDLIELGAKTLLVPGNFPIGCVPVYLDIYKSYNVEEYESDTGCIKWLNELSKYHNRLLLAELDRLRKLHPHVTIIYANYYDAMISFFRAPQIFGFKAPLHACCGSDGPYSVNRNAPCGHRNAKVCSDPSSSVSWDGIHLTEAAYGTIASSLLEGPHADPPLTRACSSTQQNTVYDF